MLSFGRRHRYRAQMRRKNAPKPCLVIPAIHYRHAGPECGQVARRFQRPSKLVGVLHARVRNENPHFELTEAGTCIPNTVYCLRASLWANCAMAKSATQNQ
ncbi:hypothetical protein GEOBC_00616 [Geobacteraceae bacterium]|nr:hypothetical protein GEOBC_00616 [Geobacteraceae bacterium]